jgi:hypothetical protein
MAKKLGKHGNNLKRTARLWRLPHASAVAPEFGDAVFWGKQKRFPQMVSMYVLAIVN